MNSFPSSQSASGVSSHSILTKNTYLLVLNAKIFNLVFHLISHLYYHMISIVLTIAKNYDMHIIIITCT